MTTPTLPICERLRTLPEADVARQAADTIEALVEALQEAKLLLRVDEEPSRSAWRKANAVISKARGESAQ